VHYVANPSGMIADETPPMIATLVVQYADKTWASFGTGPDWKTSTSATENWQQASFNDSAWKSALPFAQGANSTNPGNPWIPDSVKALRQNFAVNSPVKSARMYVTALGEYQIFLNGDRVGDQVSAPGWTDYRERVIYQTYDVT